MPDRCEAAVRELTALLHARRETEGGAGPDVPDRIEALIGELERSAAAATALIRRLTILARSAETAVADMEFGFLFDPMRQLFAIGYRVADGSLDSGRYDLLASEARLTSFVAIAKGDVPVSHWFRLGRALTPVEQDSILVSWSGSMFEYLMPALVMRAPAGSLLDQTCRLVVRRQITYGAERGVPWGVSESGYNARDLEMTYQYSNFGVPGLGLRRGLSEDVVIAPYATGLAAMIDPAAALRNFRRLADAGASGAYGFYEALDYTATGCRRTLKSRWSAPTWRTTRGCCSSPSTMPSTTERCARAFTPSRSSRRPSSCCRSGRRATSPSPGRPRKK